MQQLWKKYATQFLELGRVGGNFVPWEVQPHWWLQQVPTGGLWGWFCLACSFWFKHLFSWVNNQTWKIWLFKFDLSGFLRNRFRSFQAGKCICLFEIMDLALLFCLFLRAIDPFGITKRHKWFNTDSNRPCPTKQHCWKSTVCHRMMARAMAV